MAYKISVKLNCDGAVNFGGLQAECGGVIRDSNGDFISANELLTIFVIKIKVFEKILQFT